MKPEKGDIWRFEGDNNDFNVTVLILTDPVESTFGKPFWTFGGMPLDNERLSVVNEWAMYEDLNWRKVA